MSVKELTFGDAAARQAWAEFGAQGAITPGTEGWWKVWGAQVRHIRPGDLVLSGDNVELIADRFESKSAPLRVGFVDTDGNRFTLGARAPIALLRRGSHHLLAD